eukprot:scaffold112086_cov66-Phaeocystis_antarctica.AAC.3
MTCTPSRPVRASAGHVISPNAPLSSGRLASPQMTTRAPTSSSPSSGGPGVRLSRLTSCGITPPTHTSKNAPWRAGCSLAAAT